MKTLRDLVDALKKKAPEYVDLLTASSVAEFQEAFNALLEKAVMHLEENKKLFADLEEEGLSAVLAGSLSVPGLTVSQEKHSNGHVDLTIEADHCSPRRKILGEAKIYKGPAYHIKGIEQLLKRYMTGREASGIIIVYCRDRNISVKVTKLRKHMDDNLPCQQQGPTGDLALNWSFSSVHKHSSGEHIRVSHVGCDLCTEA